MDGEYIYKVNDVECLRRGEVESKLTGNLYLTMGYVLFRDTSQQHEVKILLKHISSVERLPLTVGGGCPLLIDTKDFRKVVFTIRRDTDCQAVRLTLAKLCYTERLDDLPCFQPGGLSPSSFGGWTNFNLEAEFKRMGVPNSAWIKSEINSNFEVCDTYPRVLYVPSTASSRDLLGCSRFRSRGRLPVLTYLHPNGRSALCRSSQPLAGFSARCLEDQAILEAIVRVNPASPCLHVVDPRPKINALTNRAKGKGYEDGSVYRGIVFRFFCVANIHVMRTGQEKLKKVFEKAAQSMSDYLAGVERSGWLGHLRVILEAAIFVAQRMEEGHSVLVHCSDGWDRTSQTCALAQLILDPYYRTLDGFQALIEKDWLAFGHKFSDRCGLLSTVDLREASPIFTQFLDCVWQLISSEPDAFEFNERFLLLLHDEVYAARYGTFVGNCHKDRIDLRLSERTPSLWSHVAQHRVDYINPFYSCRGAEADGRRRLHVMGPMGLPPQMIRVWCGLYNRWDNSLHRRQSLPDLAQTLQKNTSSVTNHLCSLNSRISQMTLLLGRTDRDARASCGANASAGETGAATTASLAASLPRTTFGAGAMSVTGLESSEGAIDNSGTVWSASSNSSSVTSGYNSSQSDTGGITAGAHPLLWDRESASSIQSTRHATGQVGDQWDNQGPDDCTSCQAHPLTPTVGQLEMEISAVSLNCCQSSKITPTCARCRLAFPAHPARKRYCQRCYLVVCERCIRTAGTGIGDHLQTSLCATCFGEQMASLHGRQLRKISNCDNLLSQASSLNADSSECEVYD